MKKLGLVVVGTLGVSAFLAFGCTTTIHETRIVEDEAGTSPKKPGTGSTSSSGGSSSSSGGSSSSSGGSSSSSSSSTSSSGGSTSSSGGSTSSSGGSTSSSGGTAPACLANTPLTAADLDAEVGWKSAVKTQGACSLAEITTFQNNFQNPAVQTYLDLGNGLGTSCQACLITLDTDATWGPIVATAADGGQSGFVNFGACFGNVEGPACGKALQYEQFCDQIACDSCQTQSQYSACIGAAAQPGKMCATFANTTDAACPNIQTTAMTCNSIVDAAKALCGP